MRMEDEKYYFAWSLHHLVMDGWCQHLVVEEVFALYEAYRGGLQPQMKRPPLYRDYIAWLQQQDEKKMEAFWRHELKGFETATQLSVERERGEAAGRSGGEGRVVVGLGGDLNDRLTELGRRRRLTVNSMVQGAWALLLSRYSGDSEVVFGGAVSGRSASVPGIETMLGVFFNTLPVRVRIEPEETVADYLTRLQERQAEAREYEFSPLLKVQKWSEVPRGTPLFEYMMVVANFPLAAVERSRGGQYKGPRTGQCRCQQLSADADRASRRRDGLALRLPQALQRRQRPENAAAPADAAGSNGGEAGRGAGVGDIAAEQRRAAAAGGGLERRGRGVRGPGEFL